MRMTCNAATWALALILATTVPALAEAQDGDGDAEAAEEEGGTQYDKIFYMKLFGGYAWADVAAVSDNETVPSDLVDAAGNGGNFGAALGFKLLFFDLGARGVYSFHGDYNLGGVMADLGVRIPIPRFEPFFRLGLGYGWMNVNANEVSDVLDSAPGGFLLDLGLGFDVWLTDSVTLGLDAAWAFYFLNRDRVADCDPSLPVCEVLGQSGDSVGGQIRIAASLGFWF